MADMELKEDCDHNNAIMMEKIKDSFMGDHNLSHPYLKNDDNVD